MWNTLNLSFVFKAMYSAPYLFNTLFNAHLTEILAFPVLLENPSAWQRWVWKSLGSSDPKECVQIVQCLLSQHPTKTGIPVYREVFGIEAFPLNLPKGLQNTCETRVGCWKEIFLLLLLILLDKTQPDTGCIDHPHPVASYQPGNQIMEMVLNANGNHFMTLRNTMTTIVSR